LFESAIAIAKSVAEKGIIVSDKIQCEAAGC
jgi:hypothetical protein